MRCDPGFISLPVAARLLGLNYRTVRHLVERGVLRGGRVGYDWHYQVNEADVTRYLAAQVAGSLDALASPAPSTQEPAACSTSPTSPAP